jgi:hypothetical protein
MMKNESKADRIIRFVLAIGFFLIGAYLLSGFWMYAFYVLGLIFLVTSLTGFCALYKLFGISTKKNPKMPMAKGAIKKNNGPMANKEMTQKK